MTTGAGHAQRRVLVAVHTLLTLKYIDRYLTLMRADPRLTFVATQGSDRYSPGVVEALPRLGLPTIPFAEAVAEPWDLVMFATHGGERFFTKAKSKVHIQHGIGAGKRANGDFTYGRYWALHRGVPKYDLMLEASHDTARRAINAVPELRGQIAVVGDPFCDDLLARVQHRTRFRRQLGVEPDQRAFLIASTWGPHGLMESMGRDLIATLERLSGECKVLLTMHNHLWAGRADLPTPWPGVLSRLPPDQITICQPLEDWVPYLVAADVALIDHGSIGLYYALTGKPAITIPVAGKAVVPTAPITRLRAQCPVARTVSELPMAIDLALRRRPARLPVWEITSYPHQAAARTRAALYQQLRLPPFQGPATRTQFS